MVTFLEGEGKKPLKTSAMHCFLYIHIAVGQASWFGFSFFPSSTPSLIFSSSEGRRVIRSSSKNLQM